MARKGSFLLITVDNPGDMCIKDISFKMSFLSLMAKICFKIRVFEIKDVFMAINYKTFLMKHNFSSFHVKLFIPEIWFCRDSIYSYIF